MGCVLFIGTIGWGISIHIMKLLIVILTPAEIVLYRMAIGTMTLFLLATIMESRVHNIKDLLIDGIVVGTFNMSIPVDFTTYAVQTVSSSLASIINGMTPLFTLLLGVFIFNCRQE